jgi:hypothetical protein
MIANSMYKILVAELKKLSPQMRNKLAELKETGANLPRRTDIVWHMLLQSMSGMGIHLGMLDMDDEYLILATI